MFCYPMVWHYHKYFASSKTQTAMDYFQRCYSLFCKFSFISDRRDCDGIHHIDADKFFWMAFRAVVDIGSTMI